MHKYTSANGIVVVPVRCQKEGERLNFHDHTCDNLVELMRRRYGEHHVGTDSHCLDLGGGADEQNAREAQEEEKHDELMRGGVVRAAAAAVPQRMAGDQLLSSAVGEVLFVNAGPRPPEMYRYQPPTWFERWFCGHTDADARLRAQERATLRRRQIDQHHKEHMERQQQRQRERERRYSASCYAADAVHRAAAAAAAKEAAAQRSLQLISTDQEQLILLAARCVEAARKWNTTDEADAAIEQLEVELSAVSTALALRRRA